MTTDTIRCPNCSSENVRFSKKYTRYDCEDCQHEFVAAEQVFAPLRIFLSYGHDANEDLVRRIYADLQQRRHDVWFDKTDIRPGDDWRRSITDGITKSDRFFSFLSKHSTRDPGVCLDEIRIALGVPGRNIQSILVENEQEVKPPPSVSHIQWLDMHDWRDSHGVVHSEKDSDGNPYAVGDEAWENWYEGKLAEIIRVVESDESRKFAGEIRTLEEYLKPLVSDFAADARIQKLLEKKLTGRTWLFEAVEEWRTAADRSSRIFWMMGMPGFGKSFFAAHLAHFYGRGTVIGVHFCAYDKPDHRSAPRIIRTLAFQLATRLPDYRTFLLGLPEIKELDRKQSAAELFDYLLANPLKLSITGGRERLLIVIDALDEAGGDGRNELVEMLARHAPSLPDWIGLVVSSRPESDVRAPLQGLNPFVLDTETEANRGDLREYLRYELALQLQHRPDADRLVEQILEKSEGVFLYAERFCVDVQHGHLSFDRPERFPQGLGGIFFQWFQRQFPDLEKFRKDVRPALRAILAAREPLPVEILQRLFNWQDEELRDFTRTLGSLFPVTTESGHEVIKPYHKSLADWLADEAKAGQYFVSVKEGHRMLAPIGWTDYLDGEALLPYWLRTLPQHLLGALAWHELVLNMHMDAITCLAFAPDGLRVASGSWDNTVRVWDAWSGQQLHCLMGHQANVSSVAFSPDGKRIITGSEDKTVRVWDPIGGGELAIFCGHADRVTSVSYSPDGMQIASASDDKTMRVWDAHRGFCLTVLRECEDRVTSISYSPDGKRIISASGDSTLYVWDAVNGECLTKDRGRVMVGADGNILGRTDLGVWCGYRNAARQNDAFGLWIQAIENVLHIYKPAPRID